MGLFGFLGNAVAAPFRIAGTVVEKGVKTTGKVIVGDFEGAADEMEEATDEVAKVVTEIVDDED